MTLIVAAAVVFALSLRLATRWERGAWFHLSVALVAWSVLLLGVASEFSAIPAAPQPQPTPTCAQVVDFPDAVPPRYGVCVSAEEAG